jgi:tellurite resistance protein
MKFDSISAGIGLVTLAAFADGNPNKDEQVVMRESFRNTDIEKFDQLLQESKVSYPEGLKKTELEMLKSLKEAEAEWALYVLAVCWKTMHADGEFKPEELKMLQRYSAELGFSLEEVQNCAEDQLTEVQEEYHLPRLDSIQTKVSLRPHEAALALCVMIGISDDDASPKEAAVMREAFKEQDLTSLIEIMKEHDLTYPDDISRLKASILQSFQDASRPKITEYLSLAKKVVEADGMIDEAELGILKEFCEEFMISMSELKTVQI